ncbi:hypothetical protein PZB74_21800 [Porifericola rhodea]|uniref:hypothetical protein n=1 Tax=Porifericola rhodea TaxID=930972 RepID=UPI00266716F1|nr:hypothetical protein [Porifericola rhodea]WKN31583.1 hypothetical protein PZB74_21800 [Porifericola rhodea]
MNRKKILICLDVADEGEMEEHFIQTHLHHPENLLLTFYLDNLIHSQENELSLVDHANALRHSAIGKQQITSSGKNSKKLSTANHSLKDILNESQYADLLLINETNYHAYCLYYGQARPMEQLLKKASCPLLVIPNKKSLIEQILLIYDASPMALITTQSLNFSLHHLCRKLPVTILLPCLSSHTLFSAQEEKILIEYLRLHFGNLGIHKVCEASSHTLPYALEPNRNLLLVSQSPTSDLPEFLQQELEAIRLTQSFHYFQYIVNLGADTKTDKSHIKR